MSNSVAEYVGGPRDGETTVFPRLPAEILIPALPADHYARMVSGVELDPFEPIRTMEGVYRFDRLTWTFSYWRDGCRPVTAGLYTWEGYR